MPTIVGRLTGASFQTELLVMNLLGLVNSLRKWEIGWPHQVDAIRSSEHLGEFIKIILTWIGITRIFTAHIYTITYLANFYSILTWCRGRILIPWMIVSAFDNFVLELTSFIITLLLWRKKSISSALFIEYMIVRAIPRVPAVYYWCIINLLRNDLHENKRRKSRQINFLAHQSVSRIPEIAERIRFGEVSYSKDYCEKSPRFASLTNLDEFSLHSSSPKYDDELDSYKRSKSLFTVLSIDSLGSDDVDEYRTVDIRILNDNSLTPTEKAMKILNIDDSDIDEARIRLGKSTVPYRSEGSMESIHKVISTSKQNNENITKTKLVSNVSSIALNSASEVEATDNVITNQETLPGASPGPGNIEKSTGIGTMVKKDENDKTASKVRSHDKIHLQNVLKISLQNPLSGCTCGQEDEGSVTPDIADSDGDLGESSDEDHKCQRDRDNSSKDMTGMEQSSNISEKTEIEAVESSKYLTTSRAASDISDDTPPFPESSIIDSVESVLKTHMTQPFESLLPHNFYEKEKQVTDHNLEYPKDTETVNYQLFRIDDITIDANEQHDNSKNIADPSMAVEETLRQKNEKNIERSGSGNAQSTNQNFPKDSISASISSQTDISNSWENHLKRDREILDVSINRKSIRLPITHFSHSNIPDRLSNAAKSSCRFSGIKRKCEKVKDHESREMKALRAYNKLTLLEDRREMEAKKNKSTFSNWIGVQDLIYTSDFTNRPTRELHKFGKSIANDNKECRVRRKKLDHVPKSQTRSRPNEKTLKLSAFNVQIDALKASISSGFSGDNKSRYRSQNGNTKPYNTMSRNNENSRKQLSKYSKPIRFQENKNIPHQSTRRIEDGKENCEIVKVEQNVNVIDGIPFSVTNRESLKNILPSISPSLYSAKIQPDSDTTIVNSTGEIEVQDRRRISSMHEAIMSIDWDFNGRSSSAMSFMPPYENMDWRHENFLWDILDDTNTMSLLQSAFSSNPENSSRGFYLGPGSTELYYVSNCLDGVVEEIMKTAKLRVQKDVCPIQSTSEIDYGDSYLQEFTVTGIENIQDSSEDTLTDSDSETCETGPDNAMTDFTASDREGMCRNSYSAGRFVIPPNDLIEKKIMDVKDNPQEEDIEWKYLKEWTSKNKEKKSITDILGHQELSHLEYWTRELKKLASNNHRSNSSEFIRHMQHLTALPGFCVVKKIMDFFRDFVAVSQSTMTSGISLTRNETVPSTSPSTNDMTSQLDRSSDMRSSDANTINDDVNNSSQFYFGTLNDRHFLANEILPSIPKEHNHRLSILVKEELDGLQKIETKVIPENIQIYPVVNQSFARTKNKSNLCNHSFPSSTIESSTELQNDDVRLQEVQHPFKSDPAVDSYDSLYSATGHSNCSNDTVSIGCHSSMEEFSTDLSHTAETRR